MKNKSLYFLVAIAGMIFFTSCKKNNLLTTNSSITLHNCTPKSIEPYICFDSLIEDSRCPVGEECIWQGTAMIKITVHEGNHAYPIKMELGKFPFPGYTNDTTINGYRIIFKDLKPYPDLHRPPFPTIEPEAFFDISG